MPNYGNRCYNCLIGETSVIQTTFETDVLCIGGGIAGLMAGIRASETGARVVVVEKANTLRSGNGGTGADHFLCYIPEAHGSDIQPIIDHVLHSPLAGTSTPNFIRTWMGKTADIVNLWDSWGIPMKYHGRWEFAGHTLPGRTMTFLKYHGQNQKPVLTRQARKRNVEIVNRVTIFDLLTNGNRVIGALGIDSREGRMVVFKARSVILCTGRLVRLYPSPTPSLNFSRSHSPATTGDGRAMAYRAGAELINVEMPRRWAGPKYFIRGGKATWVGVLRDPQDKPVGPFVTMPDRRYGDPISDIYTSLFEDYAKAGKGPVYMDCRGISDEDLEYMINWLTHEGNVGLLTHMKEEGIDLRKNSVEFITYEISPSGGIIYNERGETSLKGLYAAGDEHFGGISGAATLGWLAGESAAKSAKESALPDLDAVNAVIEEKKDALTGMLSRQTGASWQEASLALQQTMQDYAGATRSDSMLQAGLAHLRRLKEKANNNMLARNGHELMHCMEVLNLFDLGELVFLASLERKETRGNFVRVDYPFTNPLLNNKVIVCKRVDRKDITEWRQII